MNKREFLKNSTFGALGMMLAPSLLKGFPQGSRLRIAHIGVGNMGAEDLKAISSHANVDVVALCDVDSLNLSAAHKLHPQADRKRVVWGKSVSVSVDPGGRRILKKTKKKK